MQIIFLHIRRFSSCYRDFPFSLADRLGIGEPVRHFHREDIVTIITRRCWCFIGF